MPRHTNDFFNKYFTIFLVFRFSKGTRQSSIIKKSDMKSMICIASVSVVANSVAFLSVRLTTCSKEEWLPKHTLA